MFSRLRRLVGRRRTDVNLSVDAVPIPVSGENILLVSDLHLGENCKDHSRIEYLKMGADLDEHFCAFLDHHARTTPNDKPWRLVLGGDLFDFLQVTVTPPEASDEERRFGLGSHEAASKWKLDRLMERHRHVFVYLADFVGAGHRVEIIQGNHDEELFWPAVRVRFVEGLIDLYFGAESHREPQRKAFADRIRFNTWFYYQPGLLYVEHGHRFDDFCATPPQLCPLRPRAEEELAQPVSALAIRYFANLEPGFTTHDKEHWRIPDYARYYRQRGFGHVVDVVRRYLVLIGRSVRYYKEHGQFHSEAAQATHTERLDDLAQQRGLAKDTVLALDKLGATSVISQPFGLYTVLGGAEWSGIALFILVTLLVLVTSFGWITDGVVLALTVGAGLGWKRYARQAFSTDIKRKLDDAADAIHKLLNVPIVAMGHSHRPVRRRMRHDHRAFFVNTGSFLASHAPPHPRGEPCRCRATFVTIDDPGKLGRPTPILRRWCGVESAPAPFDAPPISPPSGR